MVNIFLRLAIQNFSFFMATHTQNKPNHTFFNTNNSLFFLFIFNAKLQYSLLYKQELAHEESIWAVAWGRTHERNDVEEDTETNKENNPDPEAPKEVPAEKAEDIISDFIVTGSLDDTVKVWDLKDNRLELRQQLSGHSLGVVSVAVSSDGQTIASSSLDSGLCIWKTETGQLLNQAALGPVDLWTVAFSPDDKYVISGSQEGKISLYR